MYSTVAALAMLLHLSQITPGLFCTFKKLSPFAEIKVPETPLNSSRIKNYIEDCMKMCYEDPSCVYVISYKEGHCMVSPSKGQSLRANKVFYGNHTGGEVYQLERSETVMVCPKLEEWLEENVRSTVAN